MNSSKQYTKRTRRAYCESDGAGGAVARVECAGGAALSKLEDGSPPVGVEQMLSIYFVQQSFNLPDPAVEEALYDSAVTRQFVGIDFGP